MLLQRVATLLQLQHICLLTKCIYCHKHRCCSIMPTDWVLLNTQAWSSVFTATNTAAVQIWLLVECCCKMESLGLCHSILHVSWCCASLSSIPVGMESHYQPCLLVWCLAIGHTFWCSALILISPIVLVWCLGIGHAFWCGASLQAIPSGVVPHYQPCLLVCCLTIGHTFWRGASLSAIPIGVLPHYRPWLLVWCIIINHACWYGSSL